jgi:hypothetical protein
MVYKWEGLRPLSSYMEAVVPPELEGQGGRSEVSGGPPSLLQGLVGLIVPQGRTAARKLQARQLRWYGCCQRIMLLVCCCVDV